MADETRIWHQNGALFVDDRRPYPCGSLSAVIDGDHINVCTRNNRVVVSRRFDRIAGLDGVGFESAAEAKAYLDREFAKCEPRPQKRLDNYSVRTSQDGTVTLTFTTPFATTPRILPAAIGAVSGRPNVATVTTASANGCTIQTTRARGSILSFGSAIIDVVGGVDVDVIAIEA